MTIVFQKWSEWVANTLVLFALISLLSPKVASTSISPWVAFFLVNVIYLRDGIKNKSWPWVALCSFGAVWDILLIYSRITSHNIFEVLGPVITLLEKLP